MATETAPQRQRTPPQDEGASGIAARLAPEAAQLVVVLLWASTFVVAKKAFVQIAPLAFAFVRFALMALLAFAVLMICSRGRPPVPHRRDLPRFLAAGLTGFTFYQLGFVLGLDRTSPFSSSLLIGMVPLVTLVILAAIGEPAPGRGWLGVAVAIVGVVVFLLDKRTSAGTLTGDALSLGAAVSFATYGIVNRPLVRAYPPETYTFYTLLAGTIPLLLVGAPAAAAQDWAAVSLGGWIEVAYMVALPVYVAYMLWNWAIAQRGVAATANATLLEPVFSGALSALFYGEVFGLTKLAGAALVLLGLVVARSRSKSGP